MSRVGSLVRILFGCPARTVRPVSPLTSNSSSWRTLHDGNRERKCQISFSRGGCAAGVGCIGLLKWECRLATQAPSEALHLGGDRIPCVAHPWEVETIVPGAAPIRRLNWFTLFLLAAIVAASLSIYRGWATERDLHLARIDGRNIVQFNPVDPLASFDSRWWTAEDLAELQTLPVIADLAWDGTEHRTIAVGRSALVRTGVSPGYLSFFRTAFPAGRDLNAADADLPRAVISELMAGELFPDLHLSDVIGKTVTINQRPYTIVGVYEG